MNFSLNKCRQKEAKKHPQEVEALEDHMKPKDQEQSEYYQMCPLDLHRNFTFIEDDPSVNKLFFGFFLQIFLRDFHTQQNLIFDCCKCWNRENLNATHAGSFREKLS